MQEAEISGVGRNIGGGEREEETDGSNPTLHMEKIDTCVKISLIIKGQLLANTDDNVMTPKMRN